jgi:ubiquitin-conjugating enzyme E2 R
MTFPKNYPYSPPGIMGIYRIARHLCLPLLEEFQFTRPIYHPNIYPDGKLCISILHPPGDDEISGESGAERWSPAQRAESVLLSILSLLDDAEINSAANVDASVMYRDKKAEFAARVKEDVKASLEDVPRGFIIPTHESTRPKQKEEETDFWYDSDQEDFGGSDSDIDQDMEDFDDEEESGEEHEGEH